MSMFIDGYREVSDGMIELKKQLASALANNALLTQKLQDQELELAVTTEALKELATRYLPDHEDDCPGDDTCGCAMKSLHDKVNGALVMGSSKNQLVLDHKAMNVLRALPVGAVSLYRAEGNLWSASAEGCVSKGWMKDAAEAICSMKGPT